MALCRAASVRTRRAPAVRWYKRCRPPRRPYPPSCEVALRIVSWSWLCAASGKAMASAATVIRGPCAFSRKTDAALLGRRQVRQEYVLPDGHRPRLHITYIENRVWKLFIEYARLDVCRQLLRSQPVDQSYGLADGARCHPQRGETRDHCGREGKRKHQEESLRGSPRHLRRAWQ